MKNLSDNKILILQMQGALDYKKPT